MSEIAFVTGGPYPVREGNRLELLLDGEAAFERLCQTVEGATHCVWAAITFMWPAFEFPQGRGHPLAFLHRAAERGVEIRLLFWRPDEETASLRKNAFWGAPEHLRQLEGLHPKVHVRWDRAAPGFCQHQKLWLVDAGEASSSAFLGGLNLNPHSLARPGHRGAGQNHDLYAELRGPAVADVQHNFVQRWNGASERDGGERRGADLPFPIQLPPRAGTATVQIQRTTAPHRYDGGPAPVGGQPLDGAAGERTIFVQYLQAIRQARRSIYLEHQYLEVPELVEALRGALERGVEVAVVLPATPDVPASAYVTPERRALFEARAALGEFPTFSLVGLVGQDDTGQRRTVWIHSKVMLIDDQWGTVGSANLHRFSMFGNGELNATFCDAAVARAFRTELLAEHLSLDTSALDDVEALRLLRQVATDNRARLEQGDSAWQGIAVALKIGQYVQGEDPLTAGL
ncbi:hypothetical protein GO986_20190 [Deinococcus sp. HMF7620]|uniref:PLD phosphodiesterase domain-containing protein n=1 Tax=Deinococcus arboris TaxID=2682977 RepID=A0A7C9MTM0_9DEIO|nr:phosphatidylserine/phosphatidylglycerophosphate/cardiolipin synthase family protein [Deinococcus arboris]MVN89064.1 hypothetical protein [Deinococcus arboris]